MSTRHYALPIESTKWVVPGMPQATFNWEYDEGRDRMLALYEKGKTKQWNTNERIDWSLDIDLESQQFMPDEYIPIHGSVMWDRLSRAQKDTVRHHYSAWLTS